MTKNIFSGILEWIQLRLGAVSIFLPVIINFYHNFLFQRQLEKELLVDQGLIFQSKQILNWLKQIIWLVNFSGAIFVEQKSSILSTWLAPFCRLNQRAHLHFISHAHAFDVTRRQFVERVIMKKMKKEKWKEWKNTLVHITLFSLF